MRVAQDRGPLGVANEEFFEFCVGSAFLGNSMLLKIQPGWQASKDSKSVAAYAAIQGATWDNSMLF